MNNLNVWNPPARELERVLKLISQGKGDADIAEDMGVDPSDIARIRATAHANQIKKETRNSLIGDIAARAKFLADQKVDYLRRSVATENSNTDHAVWSESRHRTKGDMIEEILMEEFQTEFDREFAEDE